MRLFKKQRQGFCSQCGNSVDLQQDEYCMKCGFHLQKRKHGKKMGIFTILILLLVLIGLFFGIRVLQGKPALPDFIREFLQGFFKGWKTK